MLSTWSPWQRGEYPGRLSTSWLMLSSPACELKQYIAPTSPGKLIYWADIAQPAVDTYIGQQRIEREELEVFKCVQVQCETQAPQETQL